jgi:hypothetical protein
MLANLRVVGAVHLDKDMTDFPANPSYGMLVLKNHVLYAYLSIGDMQTWYPIGSRQSSYVHTQGLPSLEWTVNHALGSEQVWYQIQDSDGNILSPASFTITGPNQFKLGFTEAVDGTVVVVAPASLDVPEIKAQLLKIGSEVVIDNSGMTVNGKRVLTGVTMKVGDGTSDKFTYTDSDRLNFKPGSGIALGFDASTKTVTINATGIPDGAMSAEDVAAMITTYDGTVTTKIGDAVSTAVTGVTADITALNDTLSSQIGTTRSDLVTMIDDKASHQDLIDLNGVISGQVNSLNTSLSQSIGTKVAQSSFDTYKAANDIAVSNISISSLKAAIADSLINNTTKAVGLQWDFGTTKTGGLKLSEASASNPTGVPTTYPSLMDIHTIDGSKTYPIRIGVGTSHQIVVSNIGSVTIAGRTATTGAGSSVNIAGGTATDVASFGGAATLQGGNGGATGGTTNIFGGTSTSDSSTGGSVLINGGQSSGSVGAGTKGIGGDIVLKGGNANPSVIGANDAKLGNVLLTTGAGGQAGYGEIKMVNATGASLFSMNNAGVATFFGNVNMPSTTLSSGNISIAPSALRGVPVADSMEYDGTSLYLTNSAGVRKQLMFVGDSVDGGTF